jgi:hypothetical protein
VRRTGREALARYIAGHTRPPLRFNKHLVLEPVVALDGAIARVESYYAVLEEHEGGPYVHQYGRFFDTLEKEGGRWRFRERITEVEVRQPNYRFSGEDAKPDRDREQASRTVPGEIVSRGV